MTTLITARNTYIDSFPGIHRCFNEDQVLLELSILLGQIAIRTPYSNRVYELHQKVKALRKELEYE